MKPSTTLLLKRIVTGLLGLFGSLLIAFGLFALWFAMAWADAWGGDADLEPGLGLLGTGTAVIVTMLWVRKRNRNRQAG